MDSMTPGDAQLDTTIEIVTPENIAFRYQVAGPFRRLPAFLLDVALQTLIWWAGGGLLAMLFGAVGLAGLGFGFWLILWFVLSWFYGGLFETYCNGQTPGKRMMRIRVIASDGQPINGLQAVLRNLLRAIDGVVVAFEADDFHPGRRAGWSVVVTGRAAVVTDPAEHERLLRTGPRSWMPMRDGVFVRIDAEMVITDALTIEGPGADSLTIDGGGMAPTIVENAVVAPPRRKALNCSSLPRLRSQPIQTRSCGFHTLGR